MFALVQVFRSDHLARLLQESKATVLQVLTDARTDGNPDRRAKKRLANKVEEHALKVGAKARSVVNHDAKR